MVWQQTLVIAAFGLAVLVPGIRAQHPNDYGAIVSLYSAERGNEAVTALLSGR